MLLWRRRSPQGIRRLCKASRDCIATAGSGKESRDIPRRDKAAALTRIDGAKETPSPKAHATPLKLVYDRDTTSLLLFVDACYNAELNRLDGRALWRFDWELRYAHNLVCNKFRPRMHADPKYWGGPWSYPARVYDPDLEMTPSTEALLPCQIKSIELMGGVSTFELGQQIDFEFDEREREMDFADISDKTDIWRNRVSTGRILLAVPSKALRYGALRWISSYDDFFKQDSIPMTMDASTFVKASAASGHDPVQELVDAESLGIRKCVVVDLREIGINRKVGIFVSADKVQHLEELQSRFGRATDGIVTTSAATVFDDEAWRELCVEDKVPRESTLCEVKDFLNTFEILLMNEGNRGIGENNSGSGENNSGSGENNPGIGENNSGSGENNSITDSSRKNHGAGKRTFAIMALSDDYLLMHCNPGCLLSESRM